MQKQIKILTDNQEEHKQLYENKSEELKQLQEELTNQQRQIEEKERQLGETEIHILSLEKQKTELENVVQEMKKEAEVNIVRFSLLFYDSVLYLIHLFTVVN